MYFTKDDILLLLIWMDMRMPIMDGYEATRLIKSLPEGNKTIIVALTASAFEEDRAKIIEHGGDDFVRKPFREKEIFEMLEKHLGICFIREDQKDYEAKQKETLGTDIVIAGIKSLPQVQRLDFTNAVAAIDFDAAIKAIDRIKKDNGPLAEFLARIVNAYKFDTLQKFFEEEES